MRILTLAFFCIALSGFRAHSTASPAPSTAQWVVEPGDTTKPLPPDPALKAVQNLLQPGLTDVQLNAQIEALGSYRDSPVAARALLAWLNYYPDWCRPPGHNFEYVGRRILDRPAVRALITMGEFAAPFLVEHDNSIYAKYRNSPVRSIHPERTLLEYILTRDPKVAKLAVEAALQRMADAPKNDELRAACTDFIARTVSQFDTEERSKLFPPFALSLSH